MALVTCEEMKALEEAAFASGVVAEDLMDLAGCRLGEFVHCFFCKPGTVIAYLGKGNNGGDALVALRILRERGWLVIVRSSYEADELGALPQVKLAELGVAIMAKLPDVLQDTPRPLVLLDGLLGIGAKGPLREPLVSLASEMNRLRDNVGARTVAIDLPSGLNGDTGEVGEGAVVADVTCTLGAAKRGLVADSATKMVGRLELLPLEELADPGAGEGQLITADFLRLLFPPRSFVSHKGMAGRVAVLAGSSNYLGAAVLTATGALRGGAGLVSLFVEESLCSIVRSAGLPAEVIVRPYVSAHDVLDGKFDVLVVGPGLGELNKSAADELLDLLRSWMRPVVLDADALNMMAREQAWDVLGGHCLLTPHPGEMARLLPKNTGLTRAEQAKALAKISGATVLLKGARTVICETVGPSYFNTTGSPGMATGGQGDLLSGVLGALLAQGQSTLHAACAGAWLCGRAAEIALWHDGQSEESLLPTDVSRALGRAFLDLRRQF